MHKQTPARSRHILEFVRARDTHILSYSHKLQKTLVCEKFGVSKSLSIDQYRVSSCNIDTASRRNIDPLRVTVFLPSGVCQFFRHPLSFFYLPSSFLLGRRSHFAPTQTLYFCLARSPTLISLSIVGSVLSLPLFSSLSCSLFVYKVFANYYYTNVLIYLCFCIEYPSN